MSYVDLHCHLLWDLDDGCRSRDDTVAAARSLAAAGFSDVAPSPHVQERYGGGDPRLARERLEQARALLAAEGVALGLHAGAENVLDDAFLARAASREVQGVGEHHRYALVEVPFLATMPALLDVLQRVRAAGLEAILAHPERCIEFLRPGRAAEVVRGGAALQLNLGSLTGRHGGQARKTAERFLDAGLYAVAATDLHGPEHAEAWIREALEVLAERAGAKALRRLCEENPRHVLAGEDLS